MNNARRFLHRSTRRSRGRSGATPASRLLSLFTVLFLITGLLSPFATLTASAQDATPEPTAAAIQDADGDGVEDALDVCSAGNDAIDSDADGAPDACDETPTGDTDGDGVDNATDATPNGDDDGDGVDNAVDACSAGDDAADADGDGTADACDDTPNGPAPVETAVPTEPAQPEPTAELPTAAPPTDVPTDAAPTEETSSVTVEVAEAPQVVASAPVTCAVADAANPWIASDLDDYPPGALVTLTGGGWVAGQKVDIFVDDDGVADAEMGPWSHAAVVTADAGGTLSYQFSLPDWFVANYTVTATGECSTASTAFTDSSLVTSATFDGGPPVTVAATATIGVRVFVSTNGSSGSANWRSTGWRVATSSGTLTCVDTADHDGTGTDYNELVSLTAPSTPGTYNVYLMAFSNNSCGGTASPLKTIAGAVIVKLNQTITFPAIANQTFGAADITPGASAGSGLAVTYATSGQCSPVAGKIHIDGAGTCTVTASQGGNGTYFPASDVSRSFTIANAPATLTLGSLNQSYDGNPKAVTVTTSPANLSGVSVTYNGSATAPTNAGSYAVVASLANPNYSAPNATGTLVIDPAGQTIAFPAIANTTFGDADVDPGATASSGLAVSYTASGACTIVSGKIHLTGAGSCNVTASQTGNANVNAAESVTRSFSIARATATITLSDPAPTYDGTVKAASVTTSPADLTVVLTYRLNGQPVAAPVNAGTYDVTANIDDANHGGSATGTLTIAPRPITVTADAKSKTYGETDPGLTYQITSDTTLVGADEFNGAISRTPGETAGEYAITQGTLSLNGNYALTFTGATFTIEKKAASVAPGAASKTYGEADPALTGTLVGFLPADNVTATYSRAAGEDAGAYTISATLTPASVLTNYDITSNTALFTIATRPITVTANDQIKTFTAPDPALTYGITAGSLVGDDTFTGALTRDEGANVGTYAITQGTLALNDNYALTVEPGTLTITRAEATLALVDADLSQTFDGNAKTVGVTTSPDGLSGVSVTFEDADGNAVANPTDAGEYAVTATLANANYTADAATGTLVIAPRAITVTADAQTKTYGDDDPALTYTVTGDLVGEDAFDAALTREAGENVGTYAITQGTLSLSDNYAITFSGTDLEITKRPVTVTADPKDKTYGDSDPELTYAVTGGTVVNGDEFSGALSRTAGEDVATYLIGAGDLTLGANYDLTVVPADFTITARAIAVAATNTGKVFGEGDPALDYTITDGSLAFDDAFTGSLVRETGEDVDTYAILRGDLALGGNYALSFVPGTFTITPAEATITLSGLTQVYTGTPRVVTATTTPTGLGTVVIAYDGTTAAPTDAGSYAIMAWLDNPNYTAEIVYETLTITPATQTIDFAGLTGKTFGDEPFTVQATASSGLSVSFAADGDCAIDGAEVTITGAGSCTITASQAGNGNYQAAEPVAHSFGIAKAEATLQVSGLGHTYDGTAKGATVTTEPANLDGVTVTYTDGDDNAVAAPLNAGTYTVVVTLDNADYEAAPVETELVIDPRAVTVTAAPQTKTYGAADPSLTYAVTDGSVIEGDTFGGALTRAAGENVGAYAIGQGTLTLGGNYTIAFEGADLTIAARAITVTADARGKTYGDVDPALTYKVTSGSLAGTDAFTGTLTRAAGQGVGSYAIGQGTLALNDNYDLTFVGADLTITKRAIEVTAGARTKVYNTADPALTYTITTGTLAFSDQMTGSLTRVAGEDVGSYAIQQGDLALSGNYTLTFVGASLTITKASQTIAFGTLGAKKYGDAPFTVAATASSGLPVSFAVTGACTISGATVTITAAGSCTVTASQAGNANYNAATNAARSFGIDKANLTVKGFYQPLDLGGVVNTSKGGSTVPVKFEVFGPDGKEIRDTSRISIVVQKTTCAASASEDAIETTVIGATSFRFDTTGDQFIYNWQTPKSAGSCYQLTVVPTSGNEAIPNAPVALVKLK